MMAALKIPIVVPRIALLVFVSVVVLVLLAPALFHVTLISTATRVAHVPQLLPRMLPASLISKTHADWDTFVGTKKHVYAGFPRQLETIATLLMNVSLAWPAIVPLNVPQYRRHQPAIDPRQMYAHKRTFWIAHVVAPMMVKKDVLHQSLCLPTASLSLRILSNALCRTNVQGDLAWTPILVHRNTALILPIVTTTVLWIP